MRSVQGSEAGREQIASSAKADGDLAQQKPLAGRELTAQGGGTWCSEIRRMEKEQRKARAVGLAAVGNI